MAAIVFPQNPTVNDTCQADNSTWKFDGVRWRRLPSDVSLSRLSTNDAEIGDVLAFDGEKYSPVPPFSNALEVGNLQIPDNLVGITLRINNAPFGTIPKELYPVNGKNFYLAHFIYQENNEEEDWQVFYDGGRWCAIWSYYGEGFGIAQASFAAVGNTTYPWQATGWTNGGIVNRIGTYDAALAPAPLGEDAYSGVGTKAAREDHVHPLPTPANIGAATAAQGAKADTAVQSLDAYDSIIATQLEKRGVVAISAAELRLTGETQIANPNNPDEDIDVQGAHLIALKGTVSGGTITWEVAGQGAFRSAIDAVSPAELATKQDAGDYATLVSGKVPAEQLPSYVDDVLEYKDRSVFPSTGEIGKIYVAVNGGIISATQYDNTQGFWGSNQILLVSQDGVYRGGTIRFENTGAIIIVSSGGGNDSGQPSGGYTSGVAVIGGGTRIIITASTPQVYRWSGTTYIEIAPTPTAASIGLGNCNNTSDTDKPISLATQAALDGKQVAGSYAPDSGIAPSAIEGTAVVNADPRLTDSRLPTSHKSTHSTGGADALTPANIGAEPAFTTLPISKGGTGATTATGAIVALGGVATIISQPISILAAQGTATAIYQCPAGFKFLPEEFSYFYDTVVGTSTATAGTPSNPVVRVFSNSIGTGNYDMGPAFTFLIGSAIPTLNRWYRSSNTASSVGGRPILQGGVTGSDTAYLRIETAWAAVAGGYTYSDVKIRVVMTGVLIPI
jgi:hypothetical protein